MFAPEQITFIFIFFSLSLHVCYNIDFIRMFMSRLFFDLIFFFKKIEVGINVTTSPLLNSIYASIKCTKTIKIKKTHSKQSASTLVLSLSPFSSIPFHFLMIFTFYPMHNFNETWCTDRHKSSSKKILHSFCFKISFFYQMCEISEEVIGIVFFFLLFFII